MPKKTEQRCPWAEATPLDLVYHDTEWGVPVRDDESHLFEMLTLEGAQAGLSWSTVLAKREGYRQLFHQFDPKRVAKITPKQIEKLLTNPAIIRHRGKVESTISNAQAVLGLYEAGTTLAELLWSAVDGQTVRNRWKRLDDVPPETDASKQLSKELKRRGFRFVGPTTCYALMQAAGMVNDHLTSCPRWEACDASAV